MDSFSNRQVRAGFFVLVLLCGLAGGRVALAAGEQVGRVKGRITDEKTGDPSPGAEITATSPALIGGPRQAVSDDDGRYEIPNLPPGTYTVEVGYPGVKPAVRRVLVRAGEAVPLDIKWSTEMGGVEVVTIVEQRSFTKPDSTQTGMVLNKDSMDKVATGRSYQNVAQQVPGVTGADNPTVKGAFFRNNKYLVNGLDITDPVTGTFSSNLSFDALGSVDIITGGMEAQYNALGGIINTITRGGSDTFAVNASLYVNHHELSPKENFGPHLYTGRQPWNDTKPGPSQGFQGNINVGGPIIKQKLWYNLNYEYRFAERSVTQGPPFTGVQHPGRSSINHLAVAKFNFAPSRNQRMSLTGSAYPGIFNNVVENNTVLGVAEQHQNQGGIYGILAYDNDLSSAVNVGASLGIQRFFIENGPQGAAFHDPILFSMGGGSRSKRYATDLAGCEMYNPPGVDRSSDDIRNNCRYIDDRPRHVNNTDGTAWYNQATYVMDVRRNFQFDPTISVQGRAAGRHTAKAGIQIKASDHTLHREVPGGFTYSDGRPGSAAGAAGLCHPELGQTAGCNLRTSSPTTDTNQLGYSAGVFIQDRWWPFNGLTVVPGIRFDYGKTTTTDDIVVGDLFGIGPRLGIIGDVTRDGKTIVSAYYGRANDVMLMLPTSTYDQAIKITSATQAWNQMRYDGMSEDTGWETRSTSGGPEGAEVDANAKAPYADEYSLSARREVFTNTALGVEYSHRRFYNYWDDIEVNQIWDPTGSRVVGYVDGIAHTKFRFATPDENWRRYHGLDFVLQGRPSQAWDFMAAYTLSWTYGPGSMLGTLNDNPRMMRYYTGYAGEDSRHQIKLRGSYSFRDLSIGGFMNFLSGVPSTKGFLNVWTNARSNFRSPLGTEPGTGNDAAQIAELRNPDRLNLNVRVSYNLLPAKDNKYKNRLLLHVDVFNVFNLRTPTGFTSGDLPIYGQITGRQAPFQLQAALNYLYY